MAVSSQRKMAAFIIRHSRPGGKMEGKCHGERLAAGSGSCRLVKLHRVENCSDRAMIYGLGAHHGFLSADYRYVEAVPTV